MTNNNNNIVRALICVGVLTAGIGCGDDAGGTPCEQACARIDSCPNVRSEDSCVETCEDVVAQSAALGGSCPGAVDEVIACHMALSCTDITQRAISSYHVDECTPKEQSADNCEPGDPVDPNDGRNPEPPADELALACGALCDAVDLCPTTYAESGCLDACVATFGSVGNGTAACRGAIIDTLDCQSAMTCSEIENRVLGYELSDSCRAADNRAAAICI
jgi:hypothetical protein